MWFSLLTLHGISQFAPVSTIANTSTYGSTVTLPISVTNFVNIANCILEIHYNPAVATITSATAVPTLGGSLFPNFSSPGILTLSWFTFPGVTLPDNTVIFNIVFSKVTTGTTTVSWYDDGLSCLWNDANYVDLIDVPTADYYINGAVSFLSLNAPHSILANVGGCSGAMVDVPVKVTSFTGIGKLNLTIHYDASVASFQSWNNVSGFPGLSVSSSAPGTVNISGMVTSGNSGINLSDSSVLVMLQFFHSSGSSAILWNDGGASCEYTGPPPVYQILNDIPQSEYYINGNLTGLLSPGQAGAVTGPAGGNVCAGEDNLVFSVSPVPNADTYNWTFPPGFVITGGNQTNIVTVFAGSNATSGDVSVYGMNGCGNGLSSPPFNVLVNAPPSIAGQPTSPGAVMAGTGSASFMVIANGSQIHFQWQEYVTSWNDLLNGGVYSGVASPTLTITHPPLVMNGNKYRCVVDGFCPPGVVTDGAATLTVTPVTGIAAIQSEAIGFTVFPNPVTPESKLQIQCKAGADITMCIRNIMGRQIYSWSHRSVTSDNFEMTLPYHLIKLGIYNITVFISYDGNTLVYHKKIVSRE